MNETLVHPSDLAVELIDAVREIERVASVDESPLEKAREEIYDDDASFAKAHLFLRIVLPRGLGKTHAIAEYILKHSDEPINVITKHMRQGMTVSDYMCQSKNSRPVNARCLDEKSFLATNDQWPFVDHIHGERSDRSLIMVDEWELLSDECQHQLLHRVGEQFQRNPNVRLVAFG